MPTFDTSIIRLQLEIASDPPVPPIDLNTGQPPQLWRGATVGFNLGIFDRRTGACVDLSNVDFLEVAIFPKAILNQLSDTNFNYNPYSASIYPNLPPAPLVFTTIPAADITPIIERQDWVDGITQQANAVFGFVQTSQLELNGAPKADFWLSVAAKVGGARIVYGGSWLTVYESGIQGIYLPNNLAPIDVPEDTTLYIGPNQQMPFAETINVEGTVVVDGGELAQVN